MTKHLLAGAAAGLLAFVTIFPAHAQRETIHPYLAPVDSNPDLAFPAAPSAFERKKATMLFKPDGAGPFPAIVLMPTCSGFNTSLHLFDWAERALKRGYVALVVDTLGPRGVNRSNCFPPFKINHARLLKDAFDAANHLRTLPFVDKERIALMGFSHGAMVGLGAAGAENFARDGRKPFRAVASFYPACALNDMKIPSREARVDLRFLAREVKTPLLVLMGEDDTETPPKDCLPLLSEQKALGAPLEWELYKGTTHSFDMPEYESQPFRKRDARGNDVVYRYNKDVLRVAEERAFAFIERHLGAR